ncbi:MAG TPA: DASS family sodium-coupled anion symporter [Pyrinomonadaceae bacterium]|jgi:sodium-dependent dicarboxylate transporter 2/3/5
MLRWTIIILALLLAVFAPPVLIDSQIYARTVTITGVCLILWLSESVPSFVPTFLLLTLIPLLLTPIDAKFNLSNTLSWAVDPVLALFLGGFAVGVAAERYGLDQRLARASLKSAGNSFSKFLLLVIILTAFLSMWMSNIAATALMIACLHPVVNNFNPDHLIRRILLVGVALGANLGGIATPVGTGPNAIAIASIATIQRISFLEWMIFAFPLAAGMLALGYFVLVTRLKLHKEELADFTGFLSEDESEKKKFSKSEIGFLIVLTVTILLWLGEPLHGVPAGTVSLGATCILFLSGLLKKEDLSKIDWSTLLLIAGGITLGKLLEQSGLVSVLAEGVAWQSIHPTLILFLLCLVSAMLSALMSNTATVVMLIPLASALFHQPSISILIAIAASFGIPFVISTPPNAMVYGEGGLKFNDLFLPGIFLMILGCLIISLTGQAVLNFVGIP